MDIAETASKAWTTAHEPQTSLSHEQLAHLDSLKKEFCGLLDVKYRKGQREHGGDVWLKGGMLDHAIDEVVDLAVYLLTLKQQLQRFTERVE